MSEMENVRIASPESFAGNQNDKIWDMDDVATLSSRPTREPIVYFRRKGPKRKRLDQVFVNSVATTVQQNNEHKQDEGDEVLPIKTSEKSVDNNGDGDPVDIIDKATLLRKEKVRARGPPAPPLPKKEILDYILDKLQERDTGNLFAHPVDSNEVEGYYQIITNPMDFGTLRKNLTNGLYRSLDHFEHDVLSIFKNAMEYNSKRTIYFRQARQIHELAKSYFRKLRTDFSKVTEEFQQNKVDKTSTRPRRTRSKRGTSIRIPELPDNAYERRQTWKPLEPEVDQYATIFSRNGAEGRQLVPGNGGISYRRSLKLFAKGLGPTAEKIVHQKLSMLGSMQNSPRLAAKQNEPAANRCILNSASRKGDHIAIEDYTNPSRNATSRETNPAPQASASAFLQSQHSQNLSKTHFPFVGYQGFNSSAADARGKQVASERGIQLHRQNRQPQAASFSSDARPSLLKFFHRNSRQAKASVHPSRVIKPSRLSSCNTFPIGSDSQSSLSPQLPSSLNLSRQDGYADGPVSSPRGRLNNKFATETPSQSVSPVNHDGVPFSFMQLLINEDDPAADELALQQLRRYSSSTATEPQLHRFGAACQTASALPPVNQNTSLLLQNMEQTSAFHIHDHNQASFSYMQLLMDEGDRSRDELALIEEMRRPSSQYGHDQSSATNSLQQQNHQLGTSPGALLSIGRPSSIGSQQPNLPLHFRNLNLGWHN